MVGAFHRSGAGDRHGPLLRHLHQCPRLVLRLDRAVEPRSVRRQGVRDALPDPVHLRHDPRPTAPARPPRHPATVRQRRQQHGRHAVGRARASRPGSRRQGCQHQRQRAQQSVEHRAPLRAALGADGRPELESRLLLRRLAAAHRHEAGSTCVPTCANSADRTEIATITYRSGPEWEQRFARRRRPALSSASFASPSSVEDPQTPNTPPVLCPDFLIETYLDHQGEQVRRRSGFHADSCRSASSMTPTRSSTSAKRWICSTCRARRSTRST